MGLDTDALEKSRGLMMLRYLGTRMISLCLIVVIAGCTSAEGTVVAPTSAVAAVRTNDAYVVQRGSVVRMLEFDGRISPVEEAPLYFTIPGYVKQVYVKQGEQVHRGDVLAELDTSALEDQIAEAEMRLDSAELSLSKSRIAREQAISLARLNLLVAEAELESAQHDNADAVTQASLSLELAQEELAGMEELLATYDADLVRARIDVEQSKDQLARAQIEYRESLEREWEPSEVRDAIAREAQRAEGLAEVAEAQYDQAVASKESYQHNLTAQEIRIKQAEAQLAQAKRGIDPLLALEIQRAQLLLDQLEGAVDLDLSGEVSQAQAALDQLQEQLSKAQIIAPVDGQVISLATYPGRSVEPFRAVIVIADPANVEVTASLPNEQLGVLSEGQPVNVVVSTDPDRAWTGVIRCLPQPYGTCDSPDTEAESGNAVRFSSGVSGKDAKIGTLVRITTVLEEKEDALWLPPAAIRSFQGQSYVIVEEGGRQRRVDVELGIASDDRVEVSDALKEGDIVVVP